MSKRGIRTIKGEIGKQVAVRREKPAKSAMGNWTGVASVARDCQWGLPVTVTGEVTLNRRR